METIVITPEALPVAELVNTETITPVVFDWKLKKTEWTKTIFNKLKMKEFINIYQLYGFIKADMGITYQGNPRYGGMPCEIKTELDQIKNMRNLYDVKGEYVKMAHCLPQHKWGRTTPVGYCSLSVFHRPTRHALCTDTYIDVDIENCQPQLINEICRQHNINNKELTRYNSKPKYYRLKIAEFHGTDKDTAKQLFVRLMFGGNYETWLKDHDISVNADQRHAIPYGIEKEMGAVIDAVFTHNQHIVKDVLRQSPTKWKTDGEKRRGVMGLWSQTIERRIMEDSVSYLNGKNPEFKIEEIVPCQDGLMIKKDLYYENICVELQQNIKQKYDFNIKFVVKPFDEAIEIPVFEEIKTEEEWGDAVNVKSLADTFINKYGKFVVANDTGIFVYYDNRWYNETDEKKRYKFTRYISEDLYKHIKDMIDEAIELPPKKQEMLASILRTATSCGGSFKDIVRHILSVKAGADPDVRFDNNPHLLGFENGLVELPTKTLRAYKYDDYITLTTGYKYVKPPLNPELVKKITDFFTSIQPDPNHCKLLYQVLASALDGNNYQKFWFYNGRGGNGKGVISRIMRAILGDNFCYSPKEELLKEVGRNNGASPDIADLQYKRYIIFTELGGTIKLTSFRRLTGGDQLTGRQLFQGNNHFYLHATLVGEFNNPPDFDAKAMDADYRRTIDFGFKINYTDDPDKIDKTINGVSYLKADPYYSSPEFINEASPYLLDLLLDKYKEFYSVEKKLILFDIPEDIRRASKSLVDGTNVFKQICDELYEEAEGETITAKEIWNEIQYHDKYKTLGKTAKRQYNMKALYEWVGGIYEVVGDGNYQALTIKNIRRKM